jgi:hypothetical protein
MKKDLQLELPLAAAKTEPLPAGDPAPAQQSPVASAQPSTRSKMWILLIAVPVAGIGSLMLLAASTRTSTTPPVGVSQENRTKTATGGIQHPEGAKDTSIPAMRTSAPRWVASGPSRRAGTGVMFELAADEDIDIWRKRVRPVLTVRCSAKETEVFVMTQSAASIEPTGQHTVQVSFDSGGAASEMWEHSVDHDALFAPNAKGLLHQIAGAHRMSFTFSPFNAPPALVHFSVAGFEEQLKSAAKTCGWKR